MGDGETAKRRPRLSVGSLALISGVEVDDGCEMVLDLWGLVVEVGRRKIRLQIIEIVPADFELWRVTRHQEFVVRRTVEIDRPPADSGRLKFVRPQSRSHEGGAPTFVVKLLNKKLSGIYQVGRGPGAKFRIVELAKAYKGRTRDGFDYKTPDQDELEGSITDLSIGCDWIEEDLEED